MGFSERYTDKENRNFDRVHLPQILDSVRCLEQLGVILLVGSVS